MGPTVLKIELTNGGYALVDTVWLEYLSSVPWHRTHYGYAAYRWYPRGGKGKSVVFYMHREVARVFKGEEVDHVSGNKLDNRSLNLRRCSRSQNQANKPASRSSKSGIRGVTPHEGGWMVQCGGKYVGVFRDLEAARTARNVAAQKRYGEFARIQ